MLCAIGSKKVVLITWIAILSCLLLATQALAQDSCEPIFNPSGKSISGNPGDTNILLTQVTVENIDSNYECPPTVDIGKPQIEWISQPPPQGSIDLLDPPAQDFGRNYPDSTTFDIMMELSSNLSPGIYRFSVSVDSSCADGCDDKNVFYSDATSGVFTLTVFPSGEFQCCQPSIGNQLVSAVDPGSSLPIAAVEIDSNCSGYVGAPGSMVTNISLSTSVDPAPSSGSMSFSLSSGTIDVPYGGSSSVNIVGNFSKDISPGYYDVEVTVTARCGDSIYESKIYTDKETFTLYVESMVEDECCLPVLGPQMNNAGVPGDRVPLATISISNTCYSNTKVFISRPMVTLKDLDIFPPPSSGRLFLVLVPQKPEVGSGEYETVTIYAVLTEDFPTGFYQIDSTFKVECDSPSQKSQAHEVRGNFTLSVQNEKDRSFFRGLTIPSSFMNGVCAASGSTVLIPISSIQNPETFKWEGMVNFGNGEKEAKLLAASHNAVVTVIPPGLEGDVNLQVRGPEGVSNTVSIKLDKACASNQGNEVTEEQLREWANQVPEDLMERATDQTGQFLNFVPGEVLVQFTGDPGQLEAFKEKYGIVAFDRIPPTDFYVARLGDRGIRNTIQTADGLSGESGVQYASENGLMTLIQQELNDPDLGKQEQLQATNIFTGWRTFFPIQGQGIRIAIVDTGLDLGVKDEVRTSSFAPNGVDVSSGSQDLTLLLGTSTADDRRGHGTIVSGIASARGDNQKYGAGVAFNSRVIPIKVFGRSRFASQEIIAKGLIASFYLEADVVNMSLGCSRCRPSKERQTREYFDKVLDFLYEDFERKSLTPPIIVAATGNDGEGIVDTPAADPRVIAVGSYNIKTNSRSSFSNYGEEVDFVAPGENVYTTLIGGEFGDAGSGTSFSSPQGAGLVALILSTQPKLKELGVDAVRQKMKECFVKDVAEPGFDQETGWGSIYIPDPDDVDPSKCLTFNKPGESE
ncbi:S8 family serine peptidase [Candidatus Bipolaricaulota bacterium]|nr:S8 family serine peptidase [Candidatus Bipolaricaulota bacterium]